MINFIQDLLELKDSILGIIYTNTIIIVNKFIKYIIIKPVLKSLILI